MRESSAEMRNDHTPGTEHFIDMLQNENARRLGPTVEGPRTGVRQCGPLRYAQCVAIFPPSHGRMPDWPHLVWDTEVLLPQLPQVTEYSQLPGGVTHLRLLGFTMNKLSRLVVVRHLLSVQFFKRHSKLMLKSHGISLLLEVLNLYMKKMFSQ